MATQPPQSAKVPKPAESAESDSECYTEATPNLYGSDEDSDVEQDIGIEQVKEQDPQVVQGQVQERVVGEEGFEVRSY